MKLLLSISLIALLSFLLSSCGGEETTSGVNAAESEIAQGGSTSSANSDGSEGAVGTGRPCNWTFIGSKTKKKYKYHQVPLHKALAVTPDQSTGYAAWGWSTKKKARSWALSQCKRSHSVTCKIYDIDGNVCGKSGGGSLRISTPNGDNSWKVGKKYTIKWDKGDAGSYVRIRLLKSGKTYKWIVKKTKNDGKHRWKVPSTVSVGNSYKIRVQSVSKSKKYDDSDSNFTITKSGTTGGNKDYKYLRKHNKTRLGPYTVRWPSKVISVSGAKKSEWKAGARRWPTVRFKFVSRKPKQGIQILGYRSMGKFCGYADWWYFDSGKLAKCEIVINPNIANMNCSGEGTMEHEIGHCIGVFVHTTDGGSMDANGIDRPTTAPVRNMIKLLYSLPPGTNLRPFLSKAGGLAKTTPMMRQQGEVHDQYNPSGRKLYYGGRLYTREAE